jgi:hypothetical protein
MIDAGVRFLAGVNAEISEIYVKYWKKTQHKANNKKKPFFYIINPDTGSFCWSCENPQCRKLIQNIEAYTALKEGFLRLGDTIESTTNYTKVCDGFYNGFILALATGMIKSVDFFEGQTNFFPEKVWDGAGSSLYNIDFSLPLKRQEKRSGFSKVENARRPNELNSGDLPPENDYIEALNYCEKGDSLWQSPYETVNNKTEARKLSLDGVLK